MRFMGFSKINLPVKFAALALVGAFVASLGVVALPSEAEAARRNVWSVKFKCSIDAQFGTNLVRLDTTFDPGDFFVQTIVNIHNPGDRTVKFKKKFVIMAAQHVDILPSTGPVVSSQSSAIELTDNKGHAIDCKDIRDKLTTTVLEDFDTSFTVDNLIEGWVVIESENGRKIPDLAVCANYLLATVDDDVADPSGVSLDIECIKPVRVRFRNNNPF